MLSADVQFGILRVNIQSVQIFWKVKRIISKILENFIIEEIKNLYKLKDGEGKVVLSMCHN